MRLVMISDTHGKHNDLNACMPDGDILIHAGDLTPVGRKHETIAAADWLNAQADKYKHVICIAGNHDFFLEAAMKDNVEGYIQQRMFERVTYLRDEAVIFDGVKFYGSPWTPTFCSWAFNADRGPEIKRIWDQIPANTGVLITHGPVMGLLDRVGSEHVGCADLRQTVETIRPRVHVCGHIHCDAGSTSDGYTKFFNAAVCDEKYRVVNAPLVYDL